MERSAHSVEGTAVKLLFAHSNSASGAQEIQRHLGRQRAALRASLAATSQPALSAKLALAGTGKRGERGLAEGS